MSRLRNCKVLFRLTETEYSSFKEKVKASGTSQQEYIRRSVLHKTIVNTDGIRQILPQLGHIGSNINQIAHKCNQGASPHLSELQSIRKELDVIWQSLKQLIQTLQSKKS